MPRPKILLVDDEPTHIRLFQDMLEETGAQVHVAGDGIEALDALEASDASDVSGEAKSKPFDLVLMDIRLPRLDGVQATLRIRDSRTAYCNVPIIGVTAYSLPQETGVFLQMGMNAALCKPVDPEHFLATVRRFIPRP